MTKDIVKTTLIFICILSFTSQIHAHPGKLASDGCHYCRTNCDAWGVPWNERHCSGTTTATPTTSTTTATSPKLSTPKPSPRPSPSPVLVNGMEQVQVLSVTDGDTITVNYLGKSTPVRFIGIDTPETVSPTKPVGCYGKEASSFTSSLLSGKTILMEKDVSNTDKYGRLLRYIWLDGNMVNEILVSEGYAHSSTYPPDIKYQEKFVVLERTARESQKGLWGQICNPSVTPQISTSPEPTIASPMPTPQPSIAPISSPKQKWNFWKWIFGIRQ